jgi:hypothetical protein
MELLGRVEIYDLCFYLEKSSMQRLKSLQEGAFWSIFVDDLDSMWVLSKVHAMKD